MLDTLIIQQCAPMIDHHLMQSVISVESSHNPYAIGVVGAHLLRQPQNLAEAKATASYLEQAGYNYSIGVAQVNRSNFNRFNLSLNNGFDPCTNLNAGGQILAECLNRAMAQGYQQQATHKALSCYYSGQLNSHAGIQYANKVMAKLTLVSSKADYWLTETKSPMKTINTGSAVVF
ncbi:MAG TPA: lytic transglycosylase domain-containing protein [Methylotenera sp.]|jgi:type IV secretion system protein VirB1|nr:lytic transglycosylase domain-containing protein [Methylotenera sp.]HPN02278.1 lytic transglycosylase domain-containing protein [Methylotenera sp.]